MKGQAMTSKTAAEQESEEKSKALTVALKIVKRQGATIKEISELPEKWRYHGDGECNCLTCVCANELQATLNRSKS